MRWETALLALLLAMAMPATVASGDAGDLMDSGTAARADAGSFAESDGTATPAEPDSTVGSCPTVTVEPRGGDIRYAWPGLGRLLMREAPGTNVVGAGWRGQRASLRLGVLPPAMTRVRVRERKANDWVGGGMDLFNAAEPSAGTLLVRSGPDLSLWPVLTAEEPAVLGVCPDGRDPAALCVVALSPRRPPSTVPFARLNMQTGANGHRLTAAEFSRRYGSGAGLSLFMESQEGRAPVPGGGYDLSRAGASATIPLVSCWIAEVGGYRTDSDRATPHPGLAPVSTSERLIRSETFARLSGNASSFEVYHAQAWLEARSPNGTMESTADGLTVSLAEIGPLKRLHADGGRLAAAGWLLEEKDEATAFSCEAGLALNPLGGMPLDVTVGFDLQGEDVFPVAAVSHRRDLGSPGVLTVEGALAGRHPTVLERLLRPRSVASVTDGGTTVSGNPDLEHEAAVRIAACLSRDDLLAGVGARAELVRALEPIALRPVTEGSFRPLNTHDETGGALSFWGAVGDSSGPTARLRLDIFSTKGNGTLNGLAPLPVTAACLETSVPWSLFERYVTGRLELRARAEKGRARGVWRDLADDAFLSLDAVLTGSAGSARFFLSLEDALDTDPGELDHLDVEGRRLTAGFSWAFLD